MPDLTADLQQEVSDGIKAKFEANAATPGMYGASFDLAKILASTDSFVQQVLPVLEKFVPNKTVVEWIDIAAEFFKAADHAFNQVPGSPAP
jgi:hypothetical protein